MATTGFSKVKWGDGLTVTDEGDGVVRVDGSGGVPGATGPQGPAGPAGPNRIDGSTPTPLTGLLRGNGVDVDVAVAADIPLPDRLAAVSLPPSGNDLNNATSNGWYQCSPTTANNPGFSEPWWAVLTATVNVTTNLRQLAFSYSSDKIAVRRQADSTWGPWRLMAALDDPAWTAIVFSAPAWSNLGAPYATAAHRKAGNLVMLQGIVNWTSGGAAANTAFCTLPPGYRPGATVAFNAITDTAAGTVMFVQSSGAVYCPAWAPAAGTHWVSLNGATFYAEG